MLTMLTFDTAYFVVTVVIVFMVSDTQAGCTGPDDFCPAGCLCLNENRMMSTDCSKLSKSRVPKVFASSSTSINLSGNEISAVNGQSFSRCRNLRVLRLDDNAITNISTQSFTDLTRLERLLLNNNDVDLENYNQFLKPLTALKRLDIHKNHMGVRISRDLLIAKLDLKYLALDGVDNLIFPEEFSDLRSLTDLEIYSVTGLGNRTFEHLESLPLRHLSICGGRLIDVELMTFAPLHNLESLDLSGNTNLAIDSPRWNGWNGLRWTKIRKLNLTSVVINPESGCHQLRASFFGHLNETRLTEIYLDDNGIDNINVTLSHYIPHIEVFSMQFNRLRRQSYSVLTDIHNLHNLTYFNLGGQSQIPDLPSEVDLRSSIYSVADPIRFNMPPRMEYLLLSGTHCAPGFTVRPFILSGNVSNMQVLDVSSNNIKSVNASIYVPPANFVSLQVLNLSNNLMEHFPTPMKVDGQMTMKLLDVSRNNLGGLVRKDMGGELLLCMDDVLLETINISANDIRILPKYFLQNMHTVRSVVLSSNSLSIWNTTVSSMSNLTFLDLGNNLISTIPPEYRTEFDAIAQRHPFQINLHNNRLECTCATLSFLRWVYTTKVQLINLEDYTCFHHGAQVAFSKLSEMIQELTIECSSKTWIDATASLLVVIMFLIVVFLLIYHNRWAVRYVCLKVFRSSKRYHLLQDNESYVYNAFVAYHQNDLAWVRKELLMNVEERPEHESLKLCIHHRDWIPGHTIADNIMDSIKSSAKTIVVLSESFLGSHWCDFEMQMARMRSFDEGRNVVIIVALEDIPLAQMTGTLISLRRTNTWLLWPGEEEDRPAFWQRLREAIQFPSTEPVRCECGRVTYPDGTSNQ